MTNTNEAIEINYIGAVLWAVQHMVKKVGLEAVLDGAETHGDEMKKYITRFIENSEKAGLIKVIG
jgi:bisphosphoglycerate-independent phosphoglycerate mutase (AlkP superfamily)